MNEEKILSALSKSEQLVYEFIKNTSDNGAKTINLSMNKIGELLGVSEATVHRALRKLRKQGLIGIIPSREKAESNEIVYYGFYKPEDQVSDIFQMVSRLNASVSRFREILNTKDQEIETLKRERDLLQEELNKLSQKYQKLKEEAIIDPEQVITQTTLDDGTIAYIVKK